MKVVRKNNNRLLVLGEGRLVKKGNLFLKEDYGDGKVALTLNPSGQDVRASSVQMAAQNMLNKVPQATSVTVNADDIEGVSVPNYSQSDPRSDAVQKLNVRNANGAAVQNAAKNGGTIEIDKADPQQTAMESKKKDKRLVEFKKNSIPFTKKEMFNFLRSI